MTIEQAFTEGVEAFLQSLKERARGHDIPIDATLWQHAAPADLVELTVVSRRKSYIFSLPATDLTDPHRAALCQEVMGLVLTTIKDNIPMMHGRRNPHTTDRRHAHGAAKEPPMDTKLYAAILREHSEHIGKVAADLSAQLQQLTQTLGEQNSSAPTDTADCVDGLVKLQQMLAAETESFCNRLHALIERTRPQLSAESPRHIEDSRLPTPQPEPNDRVIIRGTPSYTALTERAREAVQEARAAVAYGDQFLARTRAVLQTTEELFQHLRARREREAEQPSSVSLYQPPHPPLQASDSPPEPVPVAEPPREHRSPDK